MKDKFEKWLADHSITTHSVAAAFAVLTVAYYEVPQFHDLVFGAYGHLPQSVKAVVTAGLALYAWYRKGIGGDGK